MEPSSNVPVIFEIDDNDEANGIVHPFCCLSCRDIGSTAVEADARSRGFRITVGNADGIDGQSVCENCSKPIFRC